ncbi:DUF6301 family protein [Actinoplanes rectilineatus]|uniref:DUF6301 family protein n=1 Tax=Actinoplanes rectilineatus TaxID=113571 RepID=UPI0005F2BF03|nr:DUF6301 family protein [Actinoplanes rectilineatus]
MTTWARIGSDALRTAVTQMRDVRWSWQPDGVEELCRTMGWTLLESYDNGAFADAGLGVPGDRLRMAFRDGQVDDLKLRITQPIWDEGPERDSFLRDVFADAVDDSATVLGEPTARQQDEPPTVRWRFDDSTVLITLLESTVTVTWASNRFQDDWDRVTEALS